ncbi:MAG: hypothetical protein JW891_04765 [Candidatus Lokiarchaeota archaeon]|nr:hypothetical protein [Candidatus Lokiarchaeota archaeon]
MEISAIINNKALLNPKRASDAFFTNSQDLSRITFRERKRKRDPALKYSRPHAL